MKRNNDNRPDTPAVISHWQSGLPRLPQAELPRLPVLTDRRIVSAACSVPNWLLRAARH
ncbi:MAG: hypothetical protein WBN23_13555 [Woeseia sp.]